MARTGNEKSLGTAEGALLGRAAHALHAPAPVLADDWAVELLLPDARAAVRSTPPAPPAAGEFDPAPFLALNLGSLRYAEDAVEAAVGQGVRQYVVLGAGFDTFALRRGDLAPGLRVFEVDDPAVQRLKRERIAQAERAPAALPEFVPVDFETTALSVGLAASAFDPAARSIVSWMNTIPYVSPEGVRRTLGDLREVMAAGSRLVLNYTADVPFTESQLEVLRGLSGTVVASGEPLRSRWRPEEFEAVLVEAGFRVIEHATERDLHERYFAGRGDGLAPRFPARLVTAEPAGSAGSGS